MERQRLDDREEQKSGYNAPRRYGPPTDSRHPDPRRPDGPPSGTVVHRNCSSPAGLDPPVPRFERERLSPLHQKDTAEASPVPRFESPNSEHSDDAPLDVPLPHPHPPHPPKSILKAPPRAGPLSSVRQHSDSPGHTPPHDGGHPPSRYEGPGHMGPSRPHPPGWYEGGGPGCYDESSRFDGPHHQVPGRFDGGGPPHHNMPERFDGPGPHIPHGPMRGGDGMGRFDGPPLPQGPGRFDGPIGQQPPVRFEGQVPGPGHFEGPMQHFNNMAPGPGSGPMGFQQQRPMRFDGPPNQMGPMRFDGPGPMRFDGPIQPGPRFDMPNVPHQGGPSLYESAPGQQGPMRFAPQHNLQPPMRPMAPPIYENQLAPQQNFNMAPQRFQEPMNPQFPAGPMPFPAQPNLQQPGSFNMQPAPPFSQPTPAPFYNPAAPAVSMQQPVSKTPVHNPSLYCIHVGMSFFVVDSIHCMNMLLLLIDFEMFSCFQVNMMANLNQPFLPQNPVPFRQPSEFLPLTDTQTRVMLKRKCCLFTKCF